MSADFPMESTMNPASMVFGNPFSSPCPNKEHSSSVSGTPAWEDDLLLTAFPDVCSTVDNPGSSQIDLFCSEEELSDGDEYEHMDDVDYEVPTTPKSSEQENTKESVLSIGDSSGLLGIQCRTKDTPRLVDLECHQDTYRQLAVAESMSLVRFAFERV